MAPRENHIENNHEENTGVESNYSLEGIKSSLVGNINACGSHQDFRQAFEKYFQYQQEHELGGYGSRFVPISKYLIFFSKLWTLIKARFFSLLDCNGSQSIGSKAEGKIKKKPSFHKMARNQL